MMRGLTAWEWATLYGVAYSREQTGFCRYTARLEFEGRTLLLPELRFPFGPTLREALAEIVRRARRADAIGGSFEVYLSRQAPGRRREDYEREFLPYQNARRVLAGFLGAEAAEALLWQTKI